MIRIFRHYLSSAYLGLLLIEFIVFFAAMYIGSDARFILTASWYTEQDITYASLVFAFVLLLSCAGMGLYRRSLSLEDYNLLARTSVSFVVALIALVLIYYFFPDLLMARSVLVYATIFAYLGLMTTRYLFYRFANLKQFKRRVLVIGSGVQACRLLSINDLFIHRGFIIVGFVPLPKEATVIDSAQLIHSDKTFNEIAEDYKIDEIVIALDDRDAIAVPFDELLDCKMSGFVIMDTVVFYEREQGIISLENVQPSWLIFCDGFAQGGFRSVQKRVFDILASLLLFSVAWPIMLVATIAILWESGLAAPVFYRQLRVGENNKNFYVLKFRSMHTDAEKYGAQWAKQKDDRITRVGEVIRKYRIDELPQIFNVLRGDMSFVGPRPERPEFVKGFNERIPYYQERHRVKPGITGWAQLCYPYGADEYDTIQKLQYDLYYVKNYSLFLDLSIMFNTIEVVLWGKGAR